jgi:hypothetical protein
MPRRPKDTPAKLARRMKRRKDPLRVVLTSLSSLRVLKVRS